MSARKKSYDLETPEMNLTPLIDVVFIILIMYIVIAPLLNIDKVSLASKSAQTESSQEGSPISIHVYSDDQLKFNDEEIAIAEITGRFRQAKQLHPNARPLLFHDKKACFGTYQQIKNAAESAGFKEMDVVLAPE